MNPVNCQSPDLILHVGVSDQLANVRCGMPASLESGNLRDGTNGTLPGLSCEQRVIKAESADTCRLSGPNLGQLPRRLISQAMAAVHKFRRTLLLALFMEGWLTIRTQSSRRQFYG